MHITQLLTNDIYVDSGINGALFVIGGSACVHSFIRPLHFKEVHGTPHSGEVGGCIDWGGFHPADADRSIPLCLTGH